MNVRQFWEAVKIAGDWILDGGDPSVLRAALECGTNGSLSAAGRGHLWEQRLAALCEERGMSVTNIGHRRRKYDLLIDDWVRVQCKFLGAGNSDLKPRGRDRNGRRQYHKDDFDILAIARGTCDRRYFIPSSEIADSEGWLSTVFRPVYDEWKDNWAVFDGNFGQPARLF